MSGLFKGLKGLLAAFAALNLIVFCVIAFYRIKYPFELEWMEGGSLEHVRRVLAGKALYVRPSLEFIPFLYTPFYYYLSSAASYAFGAGFIPLRLVSFFSTLGCFVLIYLFVRKETGGAYWGVLASGLFAATFRAGGAWFDTARPDMLFVFFTLAGLYIVRFKETAGAHALAGFLFFLAFMTKQTALFIIAPVLVYRLLSGWRKALPLVLTTVLLAGGGSLLLDYVHDGWFGYYIIYLPGAHPFLKEMNAVFWREDILSKAGAALAGTVFYLSYCFASSRKAALFYSTVTIGMLGAAWLVRSRSGGYDNVLIPGYAALAITSTLGAHRLASLAAAKAPSRGALATGLVYILFAVQFALLVYDPLAQIPTRKDLEAGTRLVGLVGNLKGEVFITNHGYIAGLAGKKEYAHQIAIMDVLLPHDARSAALEKELSDSFRERRFEAVITDGKAYADILKPCYVREDLDYAPDGGFLPVTGMRTRPRYIYVSSAPSGWLWRGRNPGVLRRDVSR